MSSSSFKAQSSRPKKGIPGLGKSLRTAISLTIVAALTTESALAVSSTHMNHALAQADVSVSTKANLSNPDHIERRKVPHIQELSGKPSE